MENFVHIDKSSAKEEDYCKLNNSTNKYMTSEISKLLRTMKNLHSDEASGQKTDFVPLQV